MKKTLSDEILGMIPTEEGSETGKLLGIIKKDKHLKNDIVNLESGGAIKGFFDQVELEILDGIDMAKVDFNQIYDAIGSK